MPVARRSSWARDQTWATAATQGSDNAKFLTARPLGNSQFDFFLKKKICMWYYDLFLNKLLILA